MPTPTPDLSLIEIKRIHNDDIADLSTVLTDAVIWMNQELLTESGSQWTQNETSAANLLDNYGKDEIYIGYLAKRPVCAVIIQRKDDIFWQGANHDDALYLHKLSLISEYRGTGLAEILVDLVCERASELGRYYVRLDCLSTREKLCKFYTQPRLGFQHHGDIMIGNNTHSLFQKTI